ncbi:glycosyl transferase family group 2-domain-containing protein [Mycena sanguinolenta]|nr:glycosyl transferase family group 2-domain-containing protein [Mycena sanguinolenta]
MRRLRGWIQTPERIDSGRVARPIRLFAPFYNGLGAGLSLFFVISTLLTQLAKWRYDGEYTSFAVIFTAPYLFCVSLFFALQVIGCVSFLVGPVSQYHQNSRYYSTIPPAANPEVDNNLPHVTVEMPVHTESLKAVIEPSIRSIEKAMQTYAQQGGTSSILVHDDGLQLLDAHKRALRIAFYAEHNIGWVARPPHDDSPGGYKRKGCFKKASNMNYGLAISLKMEMHLAELQRMQECSAQGDEKSLEDKALDMAVEEVYEESGRKWKPWASNGRACRIGEIILIVDADTRVPQDCFRDAARELSECPEVAIIQHESDILQVTGRYFENGVAHFTRRATKSISMACANGDLAPFMGHNAFLRWSAIQDVPLVTYEEGASKIWSETNVSEDFDMALRLQLQGYIIRWATYSKGGFKEGVSLTVEDEIDRWQKHSYGCSEIIFNPLVNWWRLGPITKASRMFLWSDAPLHHKIFTSSYMFSYYGIAASAVLPVVNYMKCGLEIQDSSSPSYEIWLGRTVAFPIAASLGHALLDYRLGHRSLTSAFIENMRWLPFLILFFSGLGIHLATVILAHIFSCKVTWGATSKEIERINISMEIRRMLKRFKLVFLVSLSFLVAAFLLAQHIPGKSTVILPLA